MGGGEGAVIKSPCIACDIRPTQQSDPDGINHVVEGVMHSTGGIQVKEAGEKEGREVEVEKLSVLQEKGKKS